MLRAGYEKRMRALFAQPVRGDKGTCQQLKPWVALKDGVDVPQVCAGYLLLSVLCICSGVIPED